MERIIQTAYLNPAGLKTKKEKAEFCLKAYGKYFFVHKAKTFNYEGFQVTELSTGAGLFVFPVKSKEEAIKGIGVVLGQYGKKGLKYYMKFLRNVYLEGRHLNTELIRELRSRERHGIILKEGN